ncbi:MAG: hypothetical protein RL095_1124 [Verrucomicrobiota bacterium]|jgi:iron complex transport system substrate-binding protein
MTRRTLLLGGLFASCRPGAAPSGLVSLAPSLTELLCALGGAPLLRGVSDWCRHPAAIAGLPRCGSSFTPDFEAIKALRPELVLCSGSPPSWRLAGCRIDSFDQSSLPLLLESFDKLGKNLGLETAAARERSRVEAEIESCRARAARQPRVSVLLLLNPLGDSGAAPQVCAASKNDGYFSPLLEACGLDNRLEHKLAYPLLGPEQLRRLDPERIIVIASGFSDAQQARELASWQRFKALRAVQTSAIHLLTGDHVQIPGPRLPLLLADFEKIRNSLASLTS